MRSENGRQHHDRCILTISWDGLKVLDLKMPNTEDLISELADVCFGFTSSLQNVMRAKSRRACGPSFVFFAKPRNRAASKSPRSNTAMANLHRSPHMNQSSADLGIVKESQFLGLGISSCRPHSMRRVETQSFCDVPTGSMACLPHQACSSPKRWLSR